MGWHKRKKYKCKECGKDFNKFRQYKQHMEDKHGKRVRKDDK